MTNKMQAEWKASKKTCEKTLQGNTPETLIRNRKDMTHADRVRERAAARGWHVSLCHERARDCKSIRKQATDMKGLKGISWWRGRGDWKKRASVPGLRFTILEWLPSGWRKTIICYQLGSGALNSGTVYTHTHAHTACWVISLPKAGSAHSLYCSGVQYGASPKDRQKKHNVLSLNKKRGAREEESFQRSIKDDEIWGCN